MPEQRLACREALTPCPSPNGRGETSQTRRRAIWPPGSDSAAIPHAARAASFLQIVRNRNDVRLCPFSLAQAFTPAERDRRWIFLFPPAPFMGRNPLFLNRLAPHEWGWLKRTKIAGSPFHRRKRLGLGKEPVARPTCVHAGAWKAAMNRRTPKTEGDYYSAGKRASPSRL